MMTQKGKKCTTRTRDGKDVSFFHCSVLQVHLLQVLLPGLWNFIYSAQVASKFRHTQRLLSTEVIDKDLYSV